MKFKSFLINAIAGSELLSSEERAIIYRLFGGMHLEEDAYISPRCTFAHPDLSNIYMGHKSYLNRDCFLDNGASIILEDCARLGPGVRILTTSHEIGGSACRVKLGGLILKSVVIGQGSWICAGAAILPGVQIASGCVIAAGAVVTHSTAPNGLYAGIPAIRKKDL
jgi:maltose O-acetyltransferase